MVGGVAEGQLQQDHVVGSGEVVVGQCCGVGGIQQGRVHGRDLEQQRGAVVVAPAGCGVCGGQGADPKRPVGSVSVVDDELIPGGKRAELHGGVGPDPVPAALDRLARTGHEQPRSRRPGPREQEGRVEVVGMVVRDQHGAHPAEVDATRAGIRPGVDQQAAVHQCAGPAAVLAGLPRPLAAVAGAPRVGPAVSAARAEQVHAHQRFGSGPVALAPTTACGSNVGAASNAAIRLVRRNAASTRLPSSRTAVSVSAARGRS